MQSLTLICSLLFLTFCVNAQNNLQNIFGLPNSNSTNTATGGLSNFPFFNPFASLPSPCNCGTQLCTCCAEFNLGPLTINQRACFNVSYDARRLSASVSGNINQRWGFQNTISASNPPPFCMPTIFPGEIFCINYSNVVLDPTQFQSCLDVTIRFFFTTLFNFNFDCVQFSLNRGFSIVKPSQLSSGGD